MYHIRKALPIVLTIVALVTLTLATAGAQGSALQVQTPLEKAVEGIGGEDLLQDFDTLSIEASGVRFVHDEGFVVGDKAEMSGPFEVQINYDIAGDALRLDYTLVSAGNERQVSEIINADLGVLDGQDSNFGGPGVNNMSSDRWASSRKHQRLLNPHLILTEILADPGIASEGGEVLL